MNISSSSPFMPAENSRQLAAEHVQSLGTDARASMKNGNAEDSELREKFQDFVGQTFFSEMIKSMRSTQKEAAYFHGGRAEEIFQGQFDQLMTEHLSKSSAQSIAEPMYELFRAGRVS